MNEKELKSEENEILSEDEAKVRRLCAGLKRVSAPKDFDFRLKARIAAFEPKRSASPIFAFLRYAAPLGLVLVFLGFIVSNNLFPVENTQVAPVKIDVVQIPPTDEIYISSAETPTPFIASNNGPTADSGIETPRTVNINSTVSQSFSPVNRISDKVLGNSKTEPIESNQGSSRDSASRQSTIITPQTFNVNRTVETPNTFNNSASFSVKSILWEIGIDANFAGNGWKIQAVRANSLAERAGLKANDFIEAIEGLNILKETIETNTISGRKLIIVRDGAKIVIDLR